MTSRRTLLKIAVAACATCSVVSSFAASGAEEKKPFTYGLVLPLTGGAASHGLDQVKAHMWAVTEINAAGGANGHRLNPVLLDSQGKPEVGIASVSRLASVDKVPLFITGWSQVVAAVAPIANRNKMLEISIGANSTRIASLGEYVYTTYPLADVDITLLAKYAFEKSGARRAAVMFINDDSGTYGAQVFRDAFRKLGGEIVAFEGYEPNATDLTGTILKLRAASPQFVHLHGNVADTPIAIGQMRQLGVTVPISGPTGAYNPEGIRKIGKAADGLIVATVAPGPTDSPVVAKYVERWKKEEGRTPNGLPVTQYLYDGAYVVKAIAEQLSKSGKSFTGQNAREALVKIRNFDLPLTGKVTIRDNHTVTKPVYLVTVKEGEFVSLGLYE